MQLSPVHKIITKPQILLKINNNNNNNNNNNICNAIMDDKTEEMEVYSIAIYI